jgi:outer membrane protein
MKNPLFVLFLFLFSAEALALKIGYVDANALIQSSPQAKAEIKKLEAEFSERNRALRARFEDFKQRKQDLEKNAILIAAEEADAKTLELKQLQREIQRDERVYNEDYNDRRAQSLNKLRNVITDTIIKMAKREKYDLILQQVVYASQQMDITKQVLKELESLQ